MQLRGTNLVLDEVRNRKHIVSGITSSSTTIAATVQLNPLDSGSVVFLDRAAGLTITLPIGQPGITYEFITKNTVTSNSYKIVTDLTVASAVFTGSVSTVTSLGGSSLFIADDATHIAITSNGTTTGGILGGRFAVTCLSVGTWYITGSLIGSGTIVTPFATS